MRHAKAAALAVFENAWGWAEAAVVRPLTLSEWASWVVVDQTRDVPGQEPIATVEESGCCQVTLTPVLEGSENKSWKNDEEGRGTEGEGRSLVERESEGEGDVQRLSQGLRGFLTEGTTLDGHVEGGDLVD